MASVLNNSVLRSLMSVAASAAGRVAFDAPLLPVGGIDLEMAAFPSTRLPSISDPIPQVPG